MRVYLDESGADDEIVERGSEFLSMLKIAKYMFGFA